MLLGVLGKFRQGALGDQIIPVGSTHLKILAEGNKFAVRLHLALPAEGTAAQINLNRRRINGILGTGLSTLFNQGLVTVLIDLRHPPIAFIQ